MTQNIAGLSQSILNFPPLSRIRRNHGLEHATLHVLSGRHSHTSMAGHSDFGGFWILGDVPTEDIRAAVLEALQRMQNGEHNLAVHPNCGTNFVTSGTVAGVAAAAAMFGAGQRFRDKVERIPLAASLSTIALILSQPLGLIIQERFTTSGHPENLQVVEIIPSTRGRIKVHRIVTKG